MTEPEKGVEERLAEARGRLAEKRADLSFKQELIDELFYRGTDGVVILKADGTSVLNDLGASMFATPTQGDPDWMTTWKFTDLATGKDKPATELAALRAMRGLGAGYEETRIQAPNGPPVHIASYAGPLPNGGSIAVFKDINARIALEEELASQKEKLEERDEEHRILIGRLRAALDELATPVLRVATGVLVVPLIGVIDSQRAAMIGERLLGDVVNQKARYVVIDVTGVEVLDTTTADHLARLSRAVALLGAKCLLSGVQPEVAQTLVALGVKLDALSPHRNLAHALTTCLGNKGVNGNRNNGQGATSRREDGAR